MTSPETGASAPPVPHAETGAPPAGGAQQAGDAGLRVMRRAEPPPFGHAGQPPLPPVLETSRLACRPAPDAGADQIPGPAGGKATLGTFARRMWARVRHPELLLPQPGPHPLSIGRAPGSVLRLNHATVSRMHAQLRHTGDGWTLRDLGSSNGTWVNGRRVTGNVAVRPGDLVQFGQVGYRLAAP